MPRTTKNNSLQLQLQRTKSNKDIPRVNNKNKNNKNEDDYTIFQNPNHGELPEYNALKKQPSQRIKHEQEEENIFNLGKNKPKNNQVMMENNYEEKTQDNFNSSMQNEYNGKYIDK